MVVEKDIVAIIEENYAPLSPECQQELLKNLTIKSVKKGTTLVREGQFATKAYFMLKGCARAYYLKDGRDISDWFAFEYEFISSIVSFFGELPSPHYIETLEPSIILELTKEKFSAPSEER